MPEIQKKTLTNTQCSPKINPDAYWNIVKKRALNLRYGRLVIEFTVHDGQIKGAEKLDQGGEKLWPY